MGRVEVDMRGVIGYCEKCQKVISYGEKTAFGKIIPFP
jgi:hypothetical protein